MDTKSLGNMIDGRELSKTIKEKLNEKVSKLSSKPGLGVILVGEDQASKIYVSYKEKGCHEVGIESHKYTYPEDITEEDLLEKIDELNNNKNIHGILVQLPLPNHINEKKVIDSIHPDKDVDCFHPKNVGDMLIGQKDEMFLPATPKGIITLLNEIGVEISGKEAVVVGRSNIVGKPIGVLLLQSGATVTWCHSKTKDLKSHTINADILVVAVGKRNLITKDMVKEGVVILDVGMNREDGKLYGDVDFENIKNKASYITPVPGGVGPMTIAMLLENTVIAYKKQNVC